MKFYRFFHSFSILSAVAVTASLFLSACTGKGGGGSTDSGFTKAEGMIWNTTYHITYRGPEALEDSIMIVLQRVGDALNVFDEQSLVSRVNREDSTAVGPDFISVYEMARRVNAISGGAFDPTLGPLITAWGFGKGHKATADTLRIDSIMEFVGITKTALRGNMLVKDDRRINFNFSAIAKGYGCDCVAEMLERNGVKDYLVEIGGEIVAKGKSPSGEKWCVSIDRPELGAAPDAGDAEAIIEFSGMGLATSGNYRNYHEENGRIFGHTISARTGRPSQTDVLSASVLATSAMEADALATACMALGARPARQLCDSLRLPAMLVLADSTIWMSEPFKKLIVE